LLTLRKWFQQFIEEIMKIFVPIILLFWSLFSWNWPSWAAKSQNLAKFTRQGASADPFEPYRQYMVEHQIRARGIKDSRVCQAMSTVPRHLFIETSDAQLAYSDCPLPIGYHQTISQPYIVAYMTAAAQISPLDKVLEIGTGCGYQAAVLGELAKEVYTIEIIPELAERARRTLKSLGYTNIHVKTGDGAQGWAEQAPYDAIIVTAAPEQIPQPLIDQLAINAKMVIPVGKRHQDMMVLTKTPTGVIESRTIPVRFVPLTNHHN
jgi:protein-L-isoaspartate(D-aspartate) O-methyltransferase